MVEDLKKEILENYEALYNDIVSDSLFDERKIFVIKRVTDKSFKIIEEILIAIHLIIGYITVKKIQLCHLKDFIYLYLIKKKEC